MKKLLLISSAVVLLIACNKDKFQTRPDIKIKSYNSKTISPGGNLEIRLEYTDKEGDIGEGAFFGARIRLNQKPLSVADNDQNDTLNNSIPKMPNYDKGELVMTLGYGFLKESTTENDTLIFKIAVTDIAGHASDTLTTDQIIILKN
jgi:hypothetical protein